MARNDKDGLGEDSPVQRVIGESSKSQGPVVRDEVRVKRLQEILGVENPSGTMNAETRHKLQIALSAVNGGGDEFSK